MRRVARLVRGTTVLPLDIVSRASVRTVETDRGSKFSVVPQQYDMAGQGGSGELYEESWTVMLRDCGPDEIAARLAEFIAMLREAWRYTFTIRQIEPTYLMVRAAGETEFRHALVHSSPAVSGPGPDFNSALEASWKASVMQGMGLPILRYCWQDGPPGVLPALKTLTKTDQPADATTIYVANHRDTAVLTHIYNYDASLAAWSANLVAAASIPIFSVAGAAPAINDIIYFGNDEATDRPFHHVAIPIDVPGVYNCAIYGEYYDGAAWTVMRNNASGINEKMTILPACDINTVASIFKLAGTWVINVGHLTDWAPVAVNGVTGYWIRLKITVFTNMPTIPVTSATEAIYVAKTPEVRIPATAFPNGDTFPVVRMLMHHPFGGDTDEGFANTSRIIVGLKSRNLTEFVSHLSLTSAGNPAGWVGSPFTDGTQVADPQCPMGQAINISFATVTTETVRARLIGTAKLGDWTGIYRVFLRCRQIGGVVGEVSVSLNVRLVAIGFDLPTRRMATKALQVIDTGLELVDLGILTLPFTPVAQADVALLGKDLIFDVLASRSAAAATLRIADLILIPMDEWSAQYDDPLSGNLAAGTSALRGRTALDIDGGIVRPRVVKQYSHLGNLMPMEVWRNGGPWPKIPPGQTARLYFLMCHFKEGGTWGTGPFISTLGQMLAFQLYGRERYMVLRGNR